MPAIATTTSSAGRPPWTQAIPRSPLSADQVTMLAAGDNVVSSDDAAKAFALPLVDLDEQIRRVV